MIGFILTCLYTGNECNHAQNKLRLIREQSSVTADVIDSMSAGTLERIVALLDLLSSGFRREIEILCRVLPTLLEDFLPSRQVCSILSKSRRHSLHAFGSKALSYARMSWPLYSNSISRLALFSRDRYFASPS